MGHRLTATLPSPGFWRGRRVLLTGHTGFKGAWLTLWLHELGASVTGFALPPEPNSLASLAQTERRLTSIHGDIRHPASLASAFAVSQPEIVLHLAAQSLVRQSYVAPVETFATNVMGTVHLLDAARQSPSVRAVLVVTSDKCYEPRPGGPPHREADALGGHDPYSASKACAELAAAAWRHAFAGPDIATARAGNVIGGGDSAAGRLVPDCLRAWTQDKAVRVRHPNATRPWQHVLDPLCGYLLLAERLAAGPGYAGPWNFGPPESWPVRDMVQRLAAEWGSGDWTCDPGPHPAETQDLAVDASQARERLGWAPRLGVAEALGWVAAWHKHTGGPAAAMQADLRRYAVDP